MDNKELIRYCPGCGSIGEVEATYRNCCPDGNLAFKVPHNFAKACSATFNALINLPATSPAPAVVQMTDEQLRKKFEEWAKVHYPPYNLKPNKYRLHENSRWYDSERTEHAYQGFVGAILSASVVQADNPEG